MGRKAKLKAKRREKRKQGFPEGWLDCEVVLMSTEQIEKMKADRNWIVMDGPSKTLTVGVGE